MAEDRTVTGPESKRFRRAKSLRVCRLWSDI